MSLQKKQSIFLINVAKLILWANDQGYELTGGELHRSKEQQQIYLQTGKSKVAHSKHQDRLAIDLNLFINGVYQTSKEAYRPIAKKWKSLHPNNRAGYDWGWDANHIEMKE